MTFVPNISSFYTHFLEIWKERFELLFFPLGRHQSAAEALLALAFLLQEVIPATALNRHFPGSRTTGPLFSSTVRFLLWHAKMGKRRPSVARNGRKSKYTGDFLRFF